MKMVNNNSGDNKFIDKPKLVNKKDNNYFGTCFNCGELINPELPINYLCPRCLRLQDEIGSDDDWTP